MAGYYSPYSGFTAAQMAAAAAAAAQQSQVMIKKRQVIYFVGGSITGSTGLQTDLIRFYQRIKIALICI